MDLGLYGRVLWRFRYLVALGVLLALTFASLSMVRIGTDGIAYRQQEVWQNQSTLYVTQPRGFPEGRALFPPAKNPAPGETPPAYPFASAGRFASLLDLYAQFVRSDDVKAILRRRGAPQGSVDATPVEPSSRNGLSQTLAIFGTGTTPVQATTLTVMGTEALLTYLKRRQDAAGIPDGQRVAINVLDRVGSPVLLQPRKKTLPVIIFLTVLIATVALALVLENARPRSRLLEPVPGEAQHARQSQRSA
jgi:hypothetical protein